MLRHLLPISVLVVVALVLSKNPAQAESEQRLGNLPEGWKIEKSLAVSPAQAAAIGRKLDAKILKLTNTYISAQGQRLQINIIDCQTATDAQKVYKAVLEAHSGISDYALGDGNSVFEFVCNDLSLVKQARRSLGFASARLHSAAARLIKVLPPGWQVVESFLASEDQTAAIGKRLGGRIKNLSNSILSADGQQIQVNIIECPTSAEAAKVYETIRRLKAHPAFCLRLSNSVVEFVGADIPLAIKAAYELGLKQKPKRATYRISFDAAPMKTGDYMQWNNLCKLFLAADQDPANPPRDRINRLAKSFTFTDKVVLRTAGPGGAYPTYRFTPSPTPRDPIPGRAVATYTFKNLPLKLGVPSLKVQATVITTQDAFTPTTRRADAYILGPTEFWPSDDPQIIAFAKRITAGCKTQKEKIDALLKWLQPGKNIKFGGPVTGSRYGVKKTLKQRFGQCWDFSDCFITFCRALQIPSRQVAGWLYGQDGHIWAEVLYENHRWQQVDPTGGGLLKCGIYYIAYLTSEDGSIPILYLSQPKIEISEN